MTARTGLWLSALLLTASAVTMAPAQAASYVVDGFQLGAQVDRTSPNYLSYRCRPSDDFADAVTCTKQRKASKGRVVSTLIHAKDGTALYGMVDVAPVVLSKGDVQSEIKDLSRTIKSQPTKIIWFPEDESEPTAVIAIWGPVRLEEVPSDLLEAIGEGKSPHLGILVDTLGNRALSAQEFLPIYRLIGGPGYVYAASFGGAEKQHRHYVSINASELAIRQFQRSLPDLLAKDNSLASGDYSLWPDVALLTRNLALDTSPEVASKTLDGVFAKSQSNKLRSHVWSVVPLGTIQRLMADTYWRYDTYGPKTLYPKVRSDAQNLLAKEPAEPFIEFVHFVVGDFDGGLKANPNSVISDILHYASGHRIVQSLAQEALVFANTRVTSQTPLLVRDDLQYLLNEDPDDLSQGSDDHVNSSLRFINQNPILFDGKPLGDVLPDFAARAAEAQQHFESALKNPSSPHADDAAYMIGWLQLQQGNSTDALASFSRALEVGNSQQASHEDEDEYPIEGDYKPAALKRW